MLNCRHIHYKAYTKNASLPVYCVIVILLDQKQIHHKRPVECSLGLLNVFFIME